MNEYLETTSLLSVDNIIKAHEDTHNLKFIIRETYGDYLKGMCSSLSMNINMIIRLLGSALLLQTAW